MDQEKFEVKEIWSWILIPKRTGGGTVIWKANHRQMNFPMIHL